MVSDARSSPEVTDLLTDLSTACVTVMFYKTLRFDAILQKQLPSADIYPQQMPYHQQRSPSKGLVSIDHG